MGATFWNMEMTANSELYPTHFFPLHIYFVAQPAFDKQYTSRLAQSLAEGPHQTIGYKSLTYIDPQTVCNGMNRY